MSAVFSGSRLRSIRESRGIRREELAVLTGFSFPALVAWELETRPPARDTIERLSVALEVPLDAFYERTTAEVASDA